MKAKVLVLLFSCLLIAGVKVCSAEQPVCTGDRHYDGVACCPMVDPPATTTTTIVQLPPSDGCPAGCIDVEDIPACPPVTCDNGDTTNVMYVTVNRCPAVSFPKYAPCKMRGDGKARTGDVMFHGVPYKCPRRDVPKRFLIPLGR